MLRKKLHLIIEVSTAGIDKQGGITGGCLQLKAPPDYEGGILEDIFQLVGPNRAVEIMGIRLVGVNAVNGLKLLISLIFIALVFLIRRLLGLLLRRVLRGRGGERVRFWTRQASGLTTALVLLLGLFSIWFNDPGRLAAALGLLTAALAIALQRVITAIAGYFVILRGKTFNVGDRIVMGGVRGDVMAVRITQTTIMEMGQPPAIEANADPAMWVRSRQFTGRIVTVSNARIFDEPVYNYTREFPYIWEELTVPIPYYAPRDIVEQVILDAALRHTLSFAQLSEEALAEVQRRYFLKPVEIGPRLYYRLTDNWLEMTVRFVVEDRGMREVKDAMSRDILNGLERAGIAVASETLEVVGLPRVRVHVDERPLPE